MALDDPLDSGLDDKDQILFFFDEDLNREWPGSGPSGEGGLVIYWDGGSSTAMNRSRWIAGWWPDNLTLGTYATDPGIQQAISIKSHHVQYEFSVDLSTSLFNPKTGTTVGVVIGVYDYASGTFHGIWPQAVENLNTVDSELWKWGKYPFAFGDFILASSTDVSNSDGSLPDRFELSQNYPNPFNPSTQIRFSLPRACFVSLKICDLLGKEIETLLNEQKQPGEYTVQWIPEDLPSGIYLCRLRAGDYVETRKMIYQR
jgi:hypothetical protein